MHKYRNFNGKQYRQYWAGESKNQAERIAKQVKESGGNARIIFEKGHTIKKGITKGRYHLPVYRVYVNNYSGVY
jgi:hypothetical protein